VLWFSVKLSRHQLCLLVLFSAKIDFHLNLGFLFVLLSFLVTNLLANMMFTREEKSYIKFVCQSNGWSTKRICKEFSAKKWAVSSVEDQCKMQKTNSIERKTGAERPQTAWSEQNYSHVTELICSQEGNTGSSRSRREMINLTVISLSSDFCKMSSLMYFPIVSKCFWDLSIIL